MSANYTETIQDRRPGRVYQPLYFPSGAHSLFAWLHLPKDDPVGDLGLVICKPFGYEALCAHRSIRTFAESAADLGIPSLRFDYLGAGDSEDIEADADQIDTWVQDVVCAVAEMRRRTGVKRICLLGIRLGAVLATMAAAHCPEVSGLLLVAPVTSGRKYLRELRTTRLVGAPVTDTGNGAGTSPSDGTAAAGSLQFSGYPMSAATLATLSRIDLTSLAVPPTSRVLIVDRSDLASASAWRKALSADGIQVQYAALPGFVDMALVAPEFAIVPLEIVAAIGEWLPTLRNSVTPRPGRSATRADKPTHAPATAVLSIRGTTSDREATISERPVFIGSKAAMFGIVTEPCPNELRRRAVILLNSGVNDHTGAGRMHVTMARSWARHGYYVLRLDLSGIGDSQTLPDRPDGEVYPPGGVADIQAAIEFMHTRYVVRDMTLAGLCAGAYHALRAAAAGLDINRIMMMNPMTFYWTQGMSLAEVQIAEVVRNPGLYRKSVRSAAAWKRFFSGQVNIMRIVKIYARRPFLTLESALRDLARFVGLRLSRDLGTELRTIVEKGIRVVFVFSRGEPGLDLLRIQGGSAVRKLGDRCRVHIIDNADHTFTQRAPRMVAEKILSDELFSHLEDHRPIAGSETPSEAYSEF